MTRVLAFFVVVAQALDVWTWMALPPGSEVNPLAAHMNTATAWTAKLLLVEVVFLLAYSLPRLPARYRWTPAACRIASEVLVVAAIFAGAVGAGANLSVIV